jgi:integrase
MPAKRTCATPDCTKPGKLLGRLYHPDGSHTYLGYFCCKKERQEAQALARLELKEQVVQAQLPAAERITCGEYADEYLVRMESGALLTKSGRRFKSSSIGTARGQLARFTAEFSHRTLASIERHEAIRWAELHDRKQSVLQSVVTLFNLAVDEEMLVRNPFRGQMVKPEGRADEAPPTEEEMLLLLEACSALGDYAPRMRAMLTFAAYSGMRPGELFALTWDDVDVADQVVHVRQRLYRGGLDLPKSNEVRTIALTPPARDALLTLPERHGYVFVSKTGKRLAAPTLTAYWGQVRARAGLEHDFYLATKHYCVHDMKVRRGLSNADIAAQMGWSESSVETMVSVYAHSGIGAAERIRAAYSDAPFDALEARAAA